MSCEFDNIAAPTEIHIGDTRKDSSVGHLLMGFHDVEHLPSRACFSTTFLKNVVEVNASGQPHVLQLCLTVSKVMLLVKYSCSNKDSFYVSRISWRSYSCHKAEVNVATASFGDITKCKTVGSV